MLAISEFNTPKTDGASGHVHCFSPLTYFTYTHILRMARSQEARGRFVPEGKTESTF